MQVLLAPMAGLTDLPFRTIVRKFGNFLMYSEMVASQAAIRQVIKTKKIMATNGDERTAVQLVGCDPTIMAQAAKLNYDLGAKIIDINMGCPVKKIVKSYAGAALMKDKKLASEIMQSVVKAVPIPITLKIRLGWDVNNINAPEIAHIAEDIGIKLITVHARTRNQLYTGTANWALVKNVKEQVKIPVIVNGDIIDIQTAKQALKESGADGVMIGRGSLGKPWILKSIQDEEEYNISNIDKINLALQHIDLIFDFYPSPTNMTLAKKAIMYYCKGAKNATKYRAFIPTINSRQMITDTLYEIFNA